MNLPQDEIDDELRNIITNILRHISVHYAEDISSTELAKKFHIKQSVFSATFKKMTGKTFHEYLSYIRICKAKMLLLNSEMNISEFAAEVGFSRSNYFIKCFKQQMGVTPFSFKRTYKDLPATVYVVS
ncbi:MAG: AraC family transcriptional regulator [Clostridia bacterium]|nr:AraC family transcriptional regulator [Clostridia bacterium]